MNKKIIVGIVALVIIAISCGSAFALLSGKEEQEPEVKENITENQPQDNEEQDIEENEKDENETSNLSGKKVLITYFSLPENNGSAKEDSTITINGKAVGNTEYVAMLLEEKLKADVFRIEPVKNYNVNDHQALIDDAKEEQNNDARPEIKNKITNFDSYDAIFIGYPIWWSDLPQILYTFLESYDFTGKDVYLFSTNGGSGLAGTVSTITNKLKGANVNGTAFQLYRNNMETAPEEVDKWLQKLGVTE